MNSLKFWMVFSVGVAAGAAVALIYAPQKGAKTRRQLKRTLNETGDTLKEQMDDAGEYIRDQASSIGDRAGKAYKRSKDAAADASDNLQGNLQSAVKKAKRSVA